MSCPWPEGCDCGASILNSQESEITKLRDTITKLQNKLPTKSTYYLVHLDGNDFINMSYIERYRIFNNKDAAITWATKNGYDNAYNMFKDELGYLNYWAYGDKRISIIPIKANID